MIRFRSTVEAKVFCVDLMLAKTVLYKTNFNLIKMFALKKSLSVHEI